MWPMCVSLSVVVPTYNRSGRLRQCLASLLAQKVGCKWEIIVIDDFSEDETAVVAAEFAARYPNVQYIRNLENLGRCKTRNKGIEIAAGELIVMIDDDVTVDAGCLEAHLSIHRDFDFARVAVMGNVRYAPECIRGSNFGRYLQSRYLGFRIGRVRDRDDLPAKHFGTLNCSFRREDAIKVGMLDERFRYYGGEDVDFAFRLKRRGVRIVFCERAKGEHVDIVTLSRYKEKILQTARNALKIMATEAPELVESSGYRYLVPYNRCRDSVTMRLLKCFVPFLMSRRIVRCAERFVGWSDSMPMLYWAWVYHYLIAGWTIAGMDETDSDREKVSYGKSGQ